MISYQIPPKKCQPTASLCPRSKRVPGKQTGSVFRARSDWWIAIVWLLCLEGCWGHIRTQWEDYHHQLERAAAVGPCQAPCGCACSPRRPHCTTFQYRDRPHHHMSNLVTGLQSSNFIFGSSLYLQYLVLSRRSNLALSRCSRNILLNEWLVKRLHESSHRVEKQMHLPWL